MKVNAKSLVGSLAVLAIASSVGYGIAFGYGGGATGGGGVAAASPSQFNPSQLRSSAPVVNTNKGQVLGAATFSFGNNLRQGSSGNDVTELQKRLAAEGFLKISPTGFFGPLTKAAVIAYQKAHSINPTLGFVGPLTRGELNK